MPMDTAAPDGKRININSASLAELDSLPGIGPVLAQAIWNARIENGEFFFLEELMDISGIGEKRFEALKDYLVCFPDAD